MKTLFFPCYAVGSMYEDGKMTFRVMRLPENEIIFQSSARGGSPVIADYLGIVVALKRLEQDKTFMPIYASNKAAISWAKNRASNSGAENEAAKRADAYMASHDPDLIFVFHWDEKEFKETNPARYNQ